MSVSLPSAALVVPSNIQSTVLTVTPGTTKPSALNFAISVVSTTSADTRGTFRRRTAELNSWNTKPKRVVREESIVVAPIVLDSYDEMHATLPTTSSSAAATSDASTISNLLTSVKHELMHVRAARVAKFAYAKLRSRTPFSNPLRISDSPAAAENPAASPSESECTTRAPNPHLPSETLPIQESTSTPAPPPPSSSSRTRVTDATNIPDSSASAMTGYASIELVTEAEVPLESLASPILFNSWNTSRSQRPTSQTRVASPELPSIETSPRNLTIDLREKTRHPPEYASSHWSPLPQPLRTQQTVIEQTRICPINDAVAIIVETNPYTFREKGVPIDFVRRIVKVEKRRILLKMRVDVSAPSELSTPIQDRSTCGDIDRPLQTYANIVTIFSGRLKTRLCLFYDCQYTLDVLRFALPRECTVDLGQYVLLRNDALR